MPAVPPWLEPLLNNAFFTICPVHSDAARGECNMFCLDCGGDAFCFYCRSSRHENHRVIQIRRSSYHDVVRAAEIQKVLDISGVQTYVINSARVLFLNQRPQTKAAKGLAHLCEICGRSLLDPFRFCSLGCKLEGVKRNGNARFTAEGKKNEAIMEIESEEGVSSRARIRDDEEDVQWRRGLQQEIDPPATPPSQSNSRRRRKGIPRRAPLMS